MTTPSVAGDGTPRELVVEETGRLAGSAGTGGGAHMEGYLAKRRTTKWPHVWQQRYVVVHGARLKACNLPCCVAGEADSPDSATEEVSVSRSVRTRQIGNSGSFSDGYGG